MLKLADHVVWGSDIGGRQDSRGGIFSVGQFRNQTYSLVSPNWLQLLHESHFGPFIHLISINTSHKNESYPKVPELFLGIFIPKYLSKFYSNLSWSFFYSSSSLYKAKE